MRTYMIGMLLAVLMPRSAAGQSAAQPPCATADTHQFDFWSGEWVVRDSAGVQLGTNDVTKEASGCALVEHWQGAKGGAGVSLNYYDPENHAWHQEWVGNGGSILHLTGKLVDHAMEMRGRRQTAKGVVEDRITWTPLADGRVRQAWDVSTDGGATWQTSFVGYYEHPPTRGR